MSDERTSTKLLKHEISRFLASPEPEVLSIRGSWGAGKTYAWNRFLRGAKDNDAIALKKYAYVSLFGVQSLEELKYTIFESTVGSKEIGAEPTLEGLKHNTSAVLNIVGRRSISSLLGYFKNVSDVVKAVSFLSVTSQIICIDDIERKGKNLRTQDVLGLVSLLRDRRKCKVVLILNDNELEDEDKKQLVRYHEKVIDSSLLFAPTPQDCVDIALPNATGPTATLAKHTIALGISNIRVIKKIERLVLLVAPLLQFYDVAVLDQAIQSLTLFGWAHFGRTADSDDSLVDFLLKYRGGDWSGFPDPETLSDTERKWVDLLDRYSFTNLDHLDLVLLDAVKNGYIDADRLTTNAEELDAKHKAAQSDKALNDAWALVHDSFDENQDEVLTRLEDAYVKNIGVVTPSAMESLVGLLKALGHEELAKQAIEFFMDARAGESRAFFDLENHPFHSRFSDPDLAKAFSEKLATFKVEADPVSILERIDRDQGWSQKDINALCALSVADYKKIFKSERGLRMRSIVRAAVSFERISNRGTEYDPIITRARVALEEIAAESKLNERRVKGLIGPPPAVREKAAEVVAEIEYDEET
ncbi:hypothetical protein [Bradyrhizobium elkanii]|uniref:hypothetical protein n=1 Tax=Bradyrhizobium elkanii TaxID=29448 RepID=UPI001AE798CB|nr:hypothetical protein [Bradyrhizobium elkanii]MBP2431496.1 hypothetical protein [Bradyrhizobium elkanii]WLA91223.1 hypothetical protein QNJ96_40955 [Bradyrhizobium elkanii]